ncbi:UNVERIFIED_CONTAM: hypothetical protein PYX00_006058 [Menopon gallinae]|uniref:Rab proteins geranylgeranyltransferase component A n=1 Tax=Menopon gallinae TaxID=328185 RepID=A0AAW2HUD7_9NEOP
MIVDATMDDLLTDYDVIVAGTGMTESILAGALSRIGKTVLHLDSNEYYGENWASFNFDAIQTWIARMRNPVPQCESLNTQNLKESESVHAVNYELNISNVEEKWYRRTNNESTPQITSELPADGESDPNTDKPETKQEENEEYMKRESRKFNLDLCPKVLFSRGPLVELLISSNIAKYAEFKSVSRVLTWRNDHLELVPCSRADVFATKNISVVEKRLLVKILTSFLKYPDNSDELSGFENKTFFEYLKYKKLPDNIIHYILYAMAMGDKNMSCLDGVKASKSFLESLGRYGNTPFIFPMYGSGELPQCFCRLCAVFGGVYYLKRGVEGVIKEGSRCVGVVSDNKRLNASHFVFSSNHVSSELKQKKSTIRISRGIFITDRSILQSEKEPLTLLLFPPVPEVSEKSVTVIELGPGTSTCPGKVFVVHMTTVATRDAAADLSHVIDALFDRESTDSEKPKILWSVTWNATEDVSIESKLDNVKICSGPTTELDFNFSIDEARRLFKEICPDEEFLPRAPDPDEIILPCDETAEERTAEGGVDGGGEGTARMPENAAGASESENQQSAG